MYATLHELIYRLLPPMYVTIGPAQILIAIGLVGLIACELPFWTGRR